MTNRNPKSLREFIEKSKLDIDEINITTRGDLEDSLKNLKNLSQEEKTELGMLRSRVDEQSRLIMILKNRGDDYIKKNTTLEQINQELTEKKEELENECKKSNEKYNSLLDKFDYLANNHQELIKIKDEYKTKNADLTIKYVQLLDKMKNVPDEEAFMLEKSALNEKIDRLSQICSEFEDKMLNLKTENEECIKKLREEKQISQQKEKEISVLLESNNEFKNKNKELIENLDKLQEESKKTNEKHSKHLDEIIKRNHELNLICDNLKREKTILQESHSNLEKNYKTLQQELTKLKESYSRDILHDELEEANKKYNDLQKQFDAYKNYANGLIEKEKELNNKLRFMIS